MKLGKIWKETAVGLCIQEIISQTNFPQIGNQSRLMMEDTIRITTVTLTQVLTIQTGPGVSFKEYESGKGISKLERWGCPTEENTLWIVEDVAAVQTLITWEKGNDPTSQPNNTPKHQTVEMWKRTTTVRVQNLVELKDLLQESTEWETSYIFERKIINDPGPWESADRDTVMEQGYESSGL